MSLNGYSWVEGNTPNRTDPSGLQAGVCVAVVGGERFYFPCDENFQDDIPPWLDIDASSVQYLGTDVSIPDGFIPDSDQSTEISAQEIQRILDQTWASTSDWVSDRTKRWNADCNCDRFERLQGEYSYITEDDMLCHLKCLNGEVPFYYAKFMMASKQMEMDDLHPSTSGTGGVFIAPYQSPRNIADIYGFRDSYRLSMIPQEGRNGPQGGMILMKNAGNGVNRVTRLAALVEEITHAALFHNLVPFAPSCWNLTVLENEVIAKSAKYIWAIGLSGTSGFQNTEFTDNFGQGVRGAVTVAPNTCAFERCPGARPTQRACTPANSPTSNESGAGSQLGCLDPLVQTTLGI